MKSVDEAALRELRNSSKDLTSWWSNSVSSSPLEWEGVSCNDQGLLQLNFSSCPRLDTLPPEIGKLQSLDHLNLNNLNKKPWYGRRNESDQLTTLPPEIGNLKSLTVLDLNFLQKLKALPPEIGKLQRLTKLLLNYDASLKTLPSEIGNLANLNHLDLFMCWEITSLPPEIRNLKALTKLNLRCCGSLEVIPSEVFELRNLTFLSLAGCKVMREVPYKIKKLKFLTELEIDTCESLTYLPSEIGELEMLEVLDINNNKFKSLPSSICNLRNLKSLDLKQCGQLEGLPSNIGQLQALITLNLASCHQLNELPASFGQLTALTNLDIGRCFNLVLPQDVKPIDGTDAILAAYTNELIFEPYKDKPGDLHLHLQNNPHLVPSLFKHILPKSKYADWLGKVVEATPKIEKLEDDIGRSIIDAAHEMCKKRMKAALHLLGRFKVEEKSLLHRSATAAVAEATDHSDSVPMTNVALKAMSGAEQVHAEIEGRRDLKKEYVVSVTAVFADQKILTSEDADIWCKIEETAKNLEIEATIVTNLASSIQLHFPKMKSLSENEVVSLPEYPFLVVLELADRTLRDTITHEHIAGNNFQYVRHIAKQLIESLHHIHYNGLGGIHADFKPLNVVAVGAKFQLIDLDVFCKLGEPFGQKIPSSAYCPPEMAKVMVAAEDENGKIRKEKLSEYKASIAYDLWSFGVVLYELCFAKPLWRIDTSDHIDRRDLRVLACLDSDDKLKQVLNAALVVPRHDVSTDLYQASQLLRKLLDPSAEKRLEHFVTMQKVHDEPFFHSAGQDAKALKDIANGVTNLQLQLSSLSTELRDARNVLLKGMFEVAEATKTPTMFIILFEKLQDPEPSSDMQDRLQDIGEHGVGMSLDGGNLSEERMSTEEVLENGKKWVERLRSIGQNFRDGNIKEMFPSIKEGLNEFVTESTMYLYLVDDLTGLPVQGEGYPLEIKEPSKTVHTWIPAMQVGLSAMSVCNGVTGIANMFGYPVNQLVPKDWSEGLKESVELLKQKSSVEQFGVVQDVLDDETGDEKKSISLRGKSLRDFQNYLKKHDPGLKDGKEGNFAGMHVTGSPYDGTALWTKLSNESEIEKALKKRSDQIKAEKEQSDDFITSLLQNEQKSSDKSNHTNTLKKHEKINDTKMSQHEKTNNTLQGQTSQDPCFSCVTL